MENWTRNYSQIWVHNSLTSAFSWRVHSVPRNQKQPLWWANPGPASPMGFIFYSNLAWQWCCQRNPTIVRSIHLLGATYTKTKERCSATNSFSFQSFLTQQQAGSSVSRTHIPWNTKCEQLGSVGCVLPTSLIRTKCTCVCKLRNVNGNFRASAYKLNVLLFAF